MPMKVPPMSMPAWARMCSTAAGRSKRSQAVVAKEPPALGWGTTHTGSQPYFSAQADSTISARFRCSQHWAARKMPRFSSSGQIPSNTARAASRLEALPMRPPSTSEEEQPTTNTSPALSPAASSSSVTASAAWAVICSNEISIASSLQYIPFHRSGGFRPAGAPVTP